MHHTNWKIILINVVFFFCAFGELNAQRIDMTGTWKLNQQKSEFNGIPAYAAWQLMEIVQQKDNLNITYVNTDGSGLEKKATASLIINGEPEIKVDDNGLQSIRSISTTADNQEMVMTTKYIKPNASAEAGFTITQKFRIKDPVRKMNVELITDEYTLQLIYDKIKTPVQVNPNESTELPLFSIIQQRIPLYKDAIPNSIEQVKEEDKPALDLFLPEKENATGTAVIIFPGGAYSFLAYAEEGTIIAKSFAERGIAAIVVKYRLPSNETMQNKSIGPLMDAQQAIKTVRSQAAAWNIDSSKIGVIGYSAGGHLASSAGTHFNKSYIPNKEQISLRPDFMILVYPVISMKDSLTHLGSKISLLGMEPSEQNITLFSNELQVTRDTPPTYITHTGDDLVVDVMNSIVFYQALQKKGVGAELHLFQKGNHGFTQRMLVSEWINPMLDFLKRNGF